MLGFAVKFSMLIAQSPTEVGVGGFSHYSCWFTLRTLCRWFRVSLWFQTVRGSKRGLGDVFFPIWISLALITRFHKQKVWSHNVMNQQKVIMDQKAWHVAIHEHDSLGIRGLYCPHWNGAQKPQKVSKILEVTALFWGRCQNPSQRVSYRRLFCRVYMFLACWRPMVGEEE